MIFALKRYLHGHTLCTEATVQTWSHLIVLAFETSPAPQKNASSSWDQSCSHFFPRGKYPSTPLPHLNCLQENEPYHQRFFFCLTPAAGMIRRVLSLRVTPHLISSRCSLISQSAGRALFCCHLSLPSRLSQRDEIEHENQMLCVQPCSGLSTVIGGIPVIWGLRIINVVFKSHGHGWSFAWFK